MAIARLDPLVPQRSFDQGVDDGYRDAGAFPDHGRAALAAVIDRYDETDRVSLAYTEGYITGRSYHTEALNVVDLVGSAS